MANNLEKNEINDKQFIAEVDYLVYRYLLESGLEHTAFVFQSESKLLKVENNFPAVLLPLLKRGIKFTQIEYELNEKKNKQLNRRERNFSPFDAVVAIKTMESSENEMKPQSSKDSESKDSNENKFDGEAKRDDKTTNGSSNSSLTRSHPTLVELLSRPCMDLPSQNNEVSQQQVEDLSFRNSSNDPGGSVARTDSKLRELLSRPCIEPSSSNYEALQQRFLMNRKQYLLRDAPSYYTSSTSIQNTEMQGTPSSQDIDRKTHKSSSAKYTKQQDSAKDKDKKKPY